MAGPRQLNELPMANAVQPDDELLIRQGNTDRRVEVGIISGAAAGGSLLAVNNLNDLANAATARANLGAGQGDGDLLAANNLNDVANAATARANLGAGSGDGDLLAANNLGDVANAATARDNLDVSPTAETLLVAQNLADLGNDVTARNNLDVPQTATVLLKADNLAGIGNAATARANLGVGTGDGDLLAANNLSDLANAATARSNLGVGTGDGDLVAANNLNDVANAGTSRANLGAAAIAETNDFTRNIQDNMTVQSYSETTVNAGVVAAAHTLDVNASNVFSATINIATTFTFTALAGGAASQTSSIFLELTNGGAATVTWPASVQWPAGTAPELTVAGVDFILFITRDAGVTWRGVLSGKDFS